MPSSEIQNTVRTSQEKQIQSPAGESYVIDGVFAAVTMKKAVFWDVTLRGSCKNRCFEGMFFLHHHGDKNR
jgi:hypothetical protein